MASDAKTCQLYYGSCSVTLLLQFCFYGDKIPDKPENALYISNHQCSSECNKATHFVLLLCGFCNFCQFRGWLELYGGVGGGYLISGIAGIFRGAHISQISCKGPSSLTLKLVWSIRVQHCALKRPHYFSVSI